ncbi:MAG: 16S rRNA (adenine(1518)-N(6)/adenine(1519)-N(6))-dimethyltransferase RsmA [Pseudobdellovibrionaceae bacterium]
MDISEIKKRLQQLGAAPKKSLGQNFLVSDRALSLIMDSVRSLEADAFLEIGPGLGSLTERMVDLKKPITLLELDRAFCGFWREKNYSVIEGDALQLDWQTLVSEIRGSSPKVVLVSNLPYQISSSIVIDRSMDTDPLDAMVLMFQKEVAQRIQSPVGKDDYGLLTVIAQCFWDIELVLEAAPKEFYPAPQIASRVLQFKPKSHVGGIKESLDTWKSDKKAKFLNFVKQGFSQRRKFLVSNLAGFYSSKDQAQQVLGGILKSLGHDEKVRAEALSPKQWTELFVQYLAAAGK